MTGKNNNIQHSASEQNPGMQSLNEALKVFFLVLKWVMLGAIVFFLFSGVCVIKQHQVGLILRFGRLTGPPGRQALQPGLHWALPYPIDEVIKIDAGRIRALTIENFWSQETTTEILQKETGIPQPVSGKNVLQPGRDGYALTGDTNIIHFLWTVRYKLKNPLAYFTNLAQPLEINASSKQGPAAIDPIEACASDFIESALASAVLRQTGQMNIDEILKQKQGEFKNRVEKLTQQILDEMRTGIALERLDLIRVSVPGTVQASFDAVLQAEMEKSEKENQAQAYRNKVTNEAEGSSVQILAEARVYKKKTASSAEADAGYIKKLLERYPKNTEKLDVYLRQYYIETLDEVLSNVRSKYIVRSPDSEKGTLWIMLGKDPKDNEPEK